MQWLIPGHLGGTHGTPHDKVYHHKRGAQCLIHHLPNTWLVSWVNTLQQRCIRRLRSDALRARRVRSEKKASSGSYRAKLAQPRTRTTTSYMCTGGQHAALSANHMHEATMQGRQGHLPIHA